MKKLFLILTVRVVAQSCVLAAMASMSFLIFPAMAESPAAMPRDIPADKMIDFCQSQTIASATERGDSFGWKRLSDDEMAEWRSSFTGYFKGTSLESVGWKRGKDEGLSFWIASGVTAHRACAYMTRNGTGIHEALSAKFGAPNSDDTYAMTRVAFWKLGKTQVSFSEMTSDPSPLVYVNISYTP